MDTQHIHQLISTACAAAAAAELAGTSDLVVDRMTLTPPKVESYFGISRGHIHHIDNAYGFDQRFPYRTPIQVTLPCTCVLVTCLPGVFAV
jgi:hypothetical protein